MVCPTITQQSMGSATLKGNQQGLKMDRWTFSFWWWVDAHKYPKMWDKNIHHLSRECSHQTLIGWSQPKTPRASLGKRPVFALLTAFFWSQAFLSGFHSLSFSTFLEVFLLSVLSEELSFCLVFFCPLGLFLFTFFFLGFIYFRILSFATYYLYALFILFFNFCLLMLCISNTSKLTFHPRLSLFIFISSVLYYCLQPFSVLFYSITVKPQTAELIFLLLPL